MTWRISASRPSTGSICPSLCARGQVDRELVERAARDGAGACACRDCAAEPLAVRRQPLRRSKR